MQFGIEAVSKIVDAHLVVAGDGPLRQQIDSIAAELLPKRFTRLSVSPEMMPKLYQSADVFLHLSKEESFGNVFLEAMASGLPIVGYDSARLRWIVGEREFLFSSDTSSEIADKIKQAGNCGSSEKTDRLQKAKNFSWKRVSKLYQHFLQNLIDERRHESSAN